MCTTFFVFSIHGNHHMNIWTKCWIFILFCSMQNHMSEMFAYHATMMSNTLGTSTVVFTRTGFMAVLLSHYRPSGTIFAFTDEWVIFFPFLLLLQKLLHVWIFSLICSSLVNSPAIMAPYHYSVAEFQQTVIFCSLQLTTLIRSNINLKFWGSWLNVCAYSFKTVWL